MRTTAHLAIKARLILGAALLSACADGAADGSGASASEARQLNASAAMLEEDSVSLNALGANNSDDPGATAP